MIPASEVYEAAGIPVFSIGSVEPKAHGTRSALRFSLLRAERPGRPLSSRIFIATRYGDKPIAVVRDTQMASVGLAAYVRSELRLRGLKEAVDAELRPDQMDFSDLIAEPPPKLRRRCSFVRVLSEKGGLLVRQIWESGLRIQAPNSAMRPAIQLLASRRSSRPHKPPSPSSSPIGPCAPIPEMAPLDGIGCIGAGIDPEHCLASMITPGFRPGLRPPSGRRSTRGADVAPVLRQGTLRYRARDDRL